MTTNDDKPTFVLVHGAWHGQASWQDVVEALDRRGHRAVAVELPGAGSTAAFPQSFWQRPLDPEAFAREPSPNAAISQDERTAVVLEAIREESALGNGLVVLVGHSLGGLTITSVAEQVPDQVEAVVYVTALLLPGGMTANAMLTHEVMGGAVRPLSMADPAEVGALRLDTASTDADYLAAVRFALYNDVSDDRFAALLPELHCDEPTSVLQEPSPITADRFGTVDRHYVICVDDNAVVAEAQALMVRLVDDDIGTETTVHELATGHSPFYSNPEALATILAGIAGAQPPESVE